MRLEPCARLCVWEVTLACNARCVHCGSDAGAKRPAELSTAEALALCASLAKLGVQSVTLSGGEPTLRSDWPEITRCLCGHGVQVEMISNGLGIDEGLAREMKASGLASVTLSVDGVEPVHDELRGVPGALKLAVQSAQALRQAGLRVGAVTQINRLNVGGLPALERVLEEAGIEGWQLQLTMPLGRCAQHPDLALQPSEVPAVVDFMLQSPKRIPRYAADNIGWMARYEPKLRPSKIPGDRFFPGCQAGLRVLGITSEGTVRGCLSMPPQFDEGNIRDKPLEEIWNAPGAFAYNRGFRESALTGNCAPCAFRRVCRGGCKTLAFASTGGTSHNPYCLRSIEGSETSERPLTG